MIVELPIRYARGIVLVIDVIHMFLQDRDELPCSHNTMQSNRSGSIHRRSAAWKTSRWGAS